MRIADVPFGSLLREAVRAQLTELGLDTTVVAKDIGYELRCAKPVPFDLDYTRTLGYGAVKYLLGGGSGALIALSGMPPFGLFVSEFLVVLAGVAAGAYDVARSYMIRLEPEDFREPRLSQLAAQTSLQPEAFAERFGRMAGAAH